MFRQTSLHGFDHAINAPRSLNPTPSATALVLAAGGIIRLGPFGLGLARVRRRRPRKAARVRPVPTEVPRVRTVPIGHPERLRFAFWLAAAHWAILVLIQCENFLGYLLPERGRISAAARFLASMPFLQTENLLLAGALGLGARLLAGRLTTRLLALAVWTTVALYLVFNQVYYKVFFDHFRASAIEGIGRVNASILFDSLRGELGWVTYLNLAVVAGASALLARRCVTAGHSSAPPERRSVRLEWAVSAAVAIMIVAGLPRMFSQAYFNLQRHPLAVLAGEGTGRTLIAELRGARTGRAAPEAAPAPQPTEGDERLAEFGRVCHQASAKRPPNVLLIVLESVGSRQLLLPDGLPSPRATPRLAQLARRGAIFRSVYSVFPGTVRTHLAMTTGGRFLTWGSVYELLDYPYRGPTLPRAFSAAGYATALFAGERLDDENMAAAMRRAGYQTLYDFGDDCAHHTPQYMISSWGAREEYTIAKIEQWLDARADTGPFFINYMTAATHHPYGVPDGYQGPFLGTDGLARYQNALDYTDAAVGKLLDALVSRGLLDRTIVAVTGDHGEAFGTPHAMNFTHRNRLYEENIKSFLIVAPPASAPKTAPVVSSRVGTMGDLMPTLLAAAGVAVPEVPGHSLLAQDFTPEPVFFHKSVLPEQWGLRDGPWKFIATIRERGAELFDLTADPDEQVNLAALHPDRVRRYDAVCERLFLSHDEDFTAQLEGFRYAGGHALTAEQVRVPGAVTLAVGTVAADGSKRFRERTELAPDETPVACLRMTDPGTDTPIEVNWMSPTGIRYRGQSRVSAGLVLFLAFYTGPTPLERGTWTATIRDLSRGKVLSTTFAVRASVPASKSGVGRP